MKPPTLSQVEQYVKEKDLTVDPVFFLEYFTEGGWTDSRGNKVLNWKLKMLTWDRANRRRGDVHKCYCGQTGVYIQGYDDTGFATWRCIDHKPKPKPLPKEHIVNTIKFKQVPEGNKESVSDRRNKLVNDLERKKLGL